MKSQNNEIGSLNKSFRCGGGKSQFFKTAICFSVTTTLAALPDIKVLSLLGACCKITSRTEGTFLSTDVFPKCYQKNAKNGQKQGVV